MYSNDHKKFSVLKRIPLGFDETVFPRLEAVFKAKAFWLFDRSCAPSAKLHRSLNNCKSRFYIDFPEKMHNPDVVEAIISDVATWSILKVQEERIQEELKDLSSGLVDVWFKYKEQKDA